MRIDTNDRWRSKMIQPGLPWYRRPLRPADVSDALCGMMLSRGNVLEDVNYAKIVPNHFIVEVNERDYSSHFQAIQKHVIKQWNDRLLEHILVSNSRQGRREYRLGGPLQIELKAASGLLPSQARILASIDPEINEQTSPLPLHACIELNPGKRVSLRRGITTIGRDDTNDIFLDQPEIQSQRLVSGQHAYIRGDDVEYRIFDGSPSGRSSVNGTFVNNRRVPPEGQPLQDGDTIILAALDPGNPRPDIPGVAVLRFLRSCL